MSLAGRHALVTGGGSGIGAAVALALAAAGARVMICGRNEDKLAAVVTRHKHIAAQAVDVTDQQALAQLYRTAEAERGPFDTVIANAGGADSAPAEKISRSQWSETIDLNLTAAFFSVQPALAGMRSRGFGRIVFVASTAGLKGYRYVAAYVAAKHGVVGLTRALALETAKAGITVNAVCPGFTETPMLERAIDRVAAASKRNVDEARAALAAGNPQGGFVTPQQVADTVLWLCSDGAAAVTGQAISVSGGETW